VSFPAIWKSGQNFIGGGGGIFHFKYRYRFKKSDIGRLYSR